MPSTKPRMLKLAIVAALCAASLGFTLSLRATAAHPALQAASTRNPLKVTEMNIALGLDHFDAHCAACHGTDGKAGTEKGRSVAAADLTSDKTQAKSDAELFRIVSRGVPGTAMPAFAGTHKPTEIWQTILFLRELPNLTPERRAKLEQTVPAGARHKHGGNQEHQHPEAGAQTNREKPSQPSAQPPTTHQHETGQTQHPQQRDQNQPRPPQQTGEMKEHAGHQMDQMADAHDADAMLSTTTGGPFQSMTAIGSGTSLLPASAPGYMWHWMKGDWMLMAHGDLKVGFNHQGGTRGVNKAESQNWFMLMAERQAGPGRLMFRGMVSAEPWTAPRRGFPELFQTGETFEGRPLIDAQHPHDLFMELAAAYNIKLSEHVALNLYGGPVAEPALGPVAFMHRPSASENPAAPLGHHWQDSTHIAHGVITAGVTAWRFRVETSLFRGAEPDENRKDIELGKLDSWSARVWFTPTPDWSMQFSYGHLVNPEVIEPGNLERMTASVSHNRSWDDGSWATSLIWGRNHELHGNSNSYLLESTVNFLDKNYLYTRLELVDKTGLLEENIFGRPGLDNFHLIAGGLERGDRFDESFRVGAFTFGGVRDIVAGAKLRIGIGADVTFYHVPSGLKAIYDSSPASFHVFVRIRPGKMQHH